MQKIYLLLRNNIQTGPFTIDELFQQQLKPGDLIWVEGKSTSWAHPSDFDLTFHPEEKKAPEPAPQIIAAAPQEDMVSKMRVGNLVPEKDLEKRAEEIKRHVLANVQQPNYHKPNLGNQPAHVPKTIYQDNNKIHFTYKKANKSFEPSHIVAGMLVVLLIVVGWYNGWSPINQQKGSSNAVAIPGMQEMKTSVATPATSKQIQLTTEQANAAMAATVTDTVAAQPVAKIIKPKEKPALAVKTPEKLDTQATSPEPKPAANDVANNVVSQPQQSEEKAPPVVVAVPKQEVAVEEEGKKKKFGQVIAGIFKKKKKEDTKQAEEEKTTQDNNN